jgi:DNA-binding transcriptional regulator YdaS (Cro superfamily)
VAQNGSPSTAGAEKGDLGLFRLTDHQKKNEMADREFQDATDAAGGAAELARRIGISQPSVSSLSKIPTERVLSVEAVMDVARAILWPDPGGEQPGEIDDVDATRRRTRR